MGDSLCSVAECMAEATYKAGIANRDAEIARLRTELEEARSRLHQQSLELDAYRAGTRVRELEGENERLREALLDVGMSVRSGYVAAPDRDRMNAIIDAALAATTTEEE